MLVEIGKLRAVRAIGLPAGLFADVAPKVVSGWRARAAVESPSHLRRRSPAAAVTVLAALLAEREREITDSLVDPLLATVHRIGARAERKVTQELVNAFKRVDGKENILFAVAEAALSDPAGTVREGIKAVISAGQAHSEDDVRYVRRRYLTLATARMIAVAIADATFAARDARLWGAGCTAVAMRPRRTPSSSDSTHFRSWDQNLFTEWHSRYGGRGILVYWHVERGSVVVHSQTLAASASEVAAMVEGAIRHGTSMQVAGNYVDTHGQSEIGFGITRLLGVDLLPRIKRINKVRLYRPAPGQPDAYPRLAAALTRPIRWDVIAANYDQVIKYATAIRTGTASTEAILSRFTRNAAHPAYLYVLRAVPAPHGLRPLRLLHPERLQQGPASGGQDNLQRMLASIPLTDDERAAVDDGQAALDKLLERLVDVPTPAGSTPRQIGAPTTATLLPILTTTNSTSQ